MGSSLATLDEVYLLGGVGKDLNIYLTKLNLNEMSAETFDITKVRY